MIINVIDKRLGLMVLLDGTDIRVSADTTLDSLVARILDRIGGGRIDALNLCSHAQPGGLLLCQENLNRDSCFKLRGLRGRFASPKSGVYLFGCSVAIGSAAGGRDGPAFCTQLASVVGQPVFASPASQRYTLYAAGAVIDFGEWEGEMTCFMPDASAAKRDATRAA